MDKLARLQTVDGFEIATIITRSTSDRVVIWMHGIAVNKDEYLGFFRDGARFLVDYKVSSVRFDFRGHGDSSGSSMDFSVIGQNMDMKAVLQYVRKQSGLENPKVHLVAASFGAPPAIFAAARYPDLVRTVCLISPVLSYFRTFLRPETEWASELFTARHLKVAEEGGKLYMDKDFCVGARLVEEMHVIRPDIALAELRQPVLVLHGNRDSMVPYDATVQACDGLRHVKLMTMNGVDHGFMIAGDDEGVDGKSIANKKDIYRQIKRHIE